MIDFDTNRPIVEITPKQSDMYKYAKGLEKMIKSSVKEIKQRAISVTPEMFLMELSDAVNSKLGINLSILQVLAYTMLGTDIVNKDFSLPKPHTGHGVGTMDQLIWGRSLSGALSYENKVGHWQALIPISTRIGQIVLWMNSSSQNKWTWNTLIY